MVTAQKWDAYLEGMRHGVAVDQAGVKNTQLAVFQLKIEHGFQVLRDGFRGVSRGIPTPFMRKAAGKQGGIEGVGEGGHALLERLTVVAKRSVPRVAGMELIAPLPDQAAFDMVGHGFKRGREDNNGHMGALTVPGEFG